MKKISIMLVVGLFCATLASSVETNQLSCIVTETVVTGKWEEVAGSAGNWSVGFGDGTWAVSNSFFLRSDLSIDPGVTIRADKISLGNSYWGTREPPVYHKPEKGYPKKWEDILHVWTQRLYTVMAPDNLVLFEKKINLPPFRKITRKTEVKQFLATNMVIEVESLVKRGAAVSDELPAEKDSIIRALKKWLKKND